MNERIVYNNIEAITNHHQHDDEPCKFTMIIRYKVMVIMKKTTSTTKRCLNCKKSKLNSTNKNSFHI